MVEVNLSNVFIVLSILAIDLAKEVYLGVGLRELAPFFSSALNKRLSFKASLRRSTRELTMRLPSVDAASLAASRIPSNFSADRLTNISTKVLSTSSSLPELFLVLAPVILVLSNKRWPKLSKNSM